MHDMKVLGGFAGHGVVHGVRIDAGTLRRTCNDCGHSWLPPADSLIRNGPSCTAAAGGIREANGPRGLPAPQDEEAAVWGR